MLVRLLGVCHALLLPQPRLVTEPNAGRQLLPEAGAQRTLEAVSCTPWLGYPAPVYYPLGEP